MLSENHAVFNTSKVFLPALNFLTGNPGTFGLSRIGWHSGHLDIRYLQCRHVHLQQLPRLPLVWTLEEQMLQSTTPLILGC